MSLSDGEDEILSTVKLDYHVKGQQRNQQFEHMDTDSAIQKSSDCALLSAGSEMKISEINETIGGKLYSNHSDIHDAVEKTQDCVEEENEQLLAEDIVQETLNFIVQNVESNIEQLDILYATAEILDDIVTNVANNIEQADIEKHPDCVEGKNEHSIVEDIVQETLNIIVQNFESNIEQLDIHYAIEKPQDYVEKKNEQSLDEDVESNIEQSDINNAVAEILEDIVTNVANNIELADIHDAVEELLNNVIQNVENDGVVVRNNVDNKRVEDSLSVQSDIDYQKRERVLPTAESLSSEDDIPLAKLRRKRRRTKRNLSIQRQYVSEYNTSDNEPLIKQTPCDDTDISDIDPTFAPSKKDMDSSDTDWSANNEFVHLNKKMFYNPPVSESYGPKQDKTEEEKVKSESRRYANKLQERIDVQIARLDNLMVSNNLRRISVASDGNCFFESVSHHVKLPGKQIREKVCEHLETEFTEYIQFLHKEADDDDNSLYLKYFFNVAELRRAGVWDIDIGDILPLAVANIFHRKVTIYSSQVQRPVVDIEPDSPGIGEPITLALRVGKGMPQHYDVCVKQLEERKHVTMDAISGENQQDMNENQGSESLQRTEDNMSVQSDPLSNISAFGRDLDDDKSPYDKHSKPRHSTPKQNKQRMKLPTPRKKALFMTPPKKLLTRKRKQNPDKWKRNVNKKLKLSGKEYTDTRGQVRKAKNMQRVDCSKCRFKCSQHIVEEKRQELFDEFYALESYERQKDFVCANTSEKSTITILGEDDKPISKKCSTARSYSFCVDGCRTKVCKTFFRTTLAISVSYIEHALRNSGHGSFTGSEKRGHHSPGNKTNFAQRQRVRSHIETFPAVDPHYTRKDSNRKYLDQGLSIRKMFAFYKKECELNGYQPVTHGIYRKIFTEEYNLSFHKPKKDQCLLCSKYNKELSDKGHVNTNLKKEYEDHQTRKVQAREEKEEDKQKAKSSNNLNVATFDLQAVLSTPCSLVSQVYYKRKLSSYNLSVYSLGDGKGYNYVWDETEGRRGSSEISTCLYLYLSSLTPTVDTVTLYSDTCSGQNRNQHTAAALHHAVTNISYIKVINQKFLETGHTQMECDSMHSTIEYAKKRTSVYVPSQWDTVIQMARQIKPYKVIPLKHTNFWNFKKSSRSQPAIGLKQTPKTRPTIFGTIAQDKAPCEDKRRQSVGPQTLSLSQMFDMEKNGFDSHIQFIDETDALIFQDGNLLSGSLEALIQHLVPTGDYYPDRTYIFAFLLSSRLFIRPHNLLGEVCQVCIYQQNLANDQINKVSLGKFGNHIISLLSEWTELFPYDFRDDRMMKHLKDITQRVVKIYPELRKDISTMMHNLLSRLSRLQKYEDALSKLSTEALQKSQDQVVPTTDIMEVCPSPLELAQQLTHIELERLSMIGAEEFVQAFSKEVIDTETTFRDMKQTSNLEAYVQWFNRLSYLVASEICSHLKKKNRVKMIEYFIDVAKECINIGNFNSLMAIIAGMNMSPVARLKKTWSKVNTAKFQILEHQMDPSNNFGSYRSCLKAAMWRSQGAVDDREKIVIPFFSLFVKDLYFLNEGCMNRLANMNINFEKFWQVAKQISDIMAWQQVECPFEKNNKVLHYVLTSPVFSETTLSLASYECEPPENSYDKERHKTLKAQAGL